MQVTKYFLIVSMEKFKVLSRCTFIYFELDDDETMRQIVSTVIPFVKYIYIYFFSLLFFLFSKPQWDHARTPFKTT